MCKNKIDLYELVEIPVDGSQVQKIPIPDQPQLRIQQGQIIKVTDIEIFTPVVSPNTPSQAVTSPAAEIAKGFLVLKVKGEEKVHLVPLFKLNRINDGANPFQQEIEGLNDLEIDFSQSYISMGAAPAGVPYSFLIGVSYKRSK